MLSHNPSGCRSNVVIATWSTQKGTCRSNRTEPGASACAANSSGNQGNQWLAARPQYQKELQNVKGHWHNLSISFDNSVFLICLFQWKPHVSKSFQIHKLSVLESYHLSIPLSWSCLSGSLPVPATPCTQKVQRLCHVVMRSSMTHNEYGDTTSGPWSCQSPEKCCFGACDGSGALLLQASSAFVNSLSFGMITMWLDVESCSINLAAQSTSFK